MKKVFLAFLILTCFQQINAQYTNIINSKRPGFSESPYGVGTDVYQFESGLYYINNDDPSLTAKPETMGGELFFRFGKFIERLEINMNVAYQKDEVKNYIGENFYINGFSVLTFGAKYFIYQPEYADRSKEIRSWKRKTAFDKKRLIPSVGLYAGAHSNLLSDLYKKDAMSFKAAVLLQNDFSNRLVLITNLIVDDISSEDLFYSYILTVTYAINQNWSFFVENVGRYQSEYKPKYQLGTGIAYLFSPNLQVDASVRTNIFADYSHNYASAGFAWRLDRHKDKLVAKKKPAKKKKTKRKGFFGRLFSKN